MLESNHLRRAAACAVHALHSRHGICKTLGQRSRLEEVNGRCRRGTDELGPVLFRDADFVEPAHMIC